LTKIKDQPMVVNLVSLNASQAAAEPPPQDKAAQVDGIGAEEKGTMPQYSGSKLDDSKSTTAESLTQEKSSQAEAANLKSAETVPQEKFSQAEGTFSQTDVVSEPQAETSDGLSEKVLTAATTEPGLSPSPPPPGNTPPPPPILHQPAALL
jgi:hypothetical protein